MEDNEWETIQPSSSSATQSDEDDVVVVNRPTTNFTPTTHEGLLVSPQPPQDDTHLQEPVPVTPSSPSSYSSSSTPTSTEIVDSELPQPQPTEVRNTLLKASFGVLSSWVLRIAYGIRTRIGFWSIASVAAFATVVAYERRWQRWRRLAEKESRDQMALLIKQKDELKRWFVQLLELLDHGSIDNHISKIKQLLLKIDRMNEALSAQRRVPVLRVVVDNPLMIGSRANWKPT